MPKIISLKKKFASKTIFDNFSYEFSETGVFCLVGDSGAGKTTLLRILAGLDEDYEGELYGFGKDSVAYCFQEYRLFPNLTALQNITEISFNKADDAEINSAKEYLKKLRFSDSDMNLYPSELSGGMKQRVAITRALCRRTPILLFDEATKELDAELIRATLDIIKEESQRRLVIFVTHKQEEIDYLNATKITVA